jgi:hypothetical protein
MDHALSLQTQTVGSSTGPILAFFLTLFPFWEEYSPFCVSQRECSFRLPCMHERPTADRIQWASSEALKIPCKLAKALSSRYLRVCGVWVCDYWLVIRNVILRVRANKNITSILMYSSTNLLVSYDACMEFNQSTCIIWFICISRIIY